MDSLVTRWGRGGERERQACTTACSCSQRNVTCSWSACNCKFVRRRREAVERGGVRRWRRKRGQPGVSALTSATPRFFCHRSVPLHLHTAPQCTPRRLPWLVFHPRVPSPAWNQSRNENAFTCWPARNHPYSSIGPGDNLCLWPS